MHAAATMIRTPVDVVIGPPCSSNAVSGAGQLFNSFNKPVISWSAASPDLSNKKDYPTFLRTVGPYSAMNNVAIELMLHHNWNRINIIGTQDGLYNPTANDLRAKAESIGVVIDVMPYVNSLQSGGDPLPWVESMQHELARVVFLYGYCADMREILLQFKRAGYMNGDWAIITIEVFDKCALDSSSTPDGDDVEAAMAFDNVISLNWANPDPDRLEDFVQKLTDLRFGFQEYLPPPGGPALESGLADEIRSERMGVGEVGEYVIPVDGSVTDSNYLYYSCALYEAVLLYARTATKMILDEEDFTNAVKFAEYAISLDSYEGKCGTVKLNEFGDLKPAISIQQVTVQSQSSTLLELTTIGHYDSVRDVITLLQPLTFPGGSEKIPHAVAASPEEIDPIVLGVFMVLGYVVFVYCLVILVFVWRWRFIRIVRFQSPSFSIAMLVGAMLGSVEVIQASTFGNSNCFAFHCLKGMYET